ncbi:hypothetical protein [uncultured Novosphingobium sp.]|uniref:hypothetical protein n=1 Tax=uncultured Novosphingobium sp. TaxID=292277 RepID=UPI00259ADC09|nr:hypothetical protein [uncultured Novosphingobium sp.]
MIHDLPFRHQQALDPSSLTTLAASMHALIRGIEDCRNAGDDPACDPAIILLIRHLAGKFASSGSEPALRMTCARRIEELDRFPALLALALRGVAHDAAAKERFHIDGRKALRRFAQELFADGASFSVTSYPGDPAIAGDIVLTSPDMEMTLSIGQLHRSNEVRYHARRGPAARQPLRFASLRDFLKVERFAARVRRELRLADISDASPGEVQQPISAQDGAHHERISLR